MLQKIFIKDYKNISDRKVRSQYGLLAGVFGIITNLILCIAKVIIGFIANSVTIIADGFNNLSDLLSSLITIIGFKLAKRKADKEHPFGHARYEYITGSIIAYFIFLMGVVFLNESVHKIIKPETLTINFTTYIILFLAILIKFFQMYVYLDLANSSNSTTIKASAYDSRNDALCTSVVLISTIIMGIFNINIDGIMGVIVSIFIIYSSIVLIKETIDPLLGLKPTKKQVDFIMKKVLENKKIHGIHDLIIHNYGETVSFVTLHAEVDENMSIIEAHDLMDSIEREFKDKYNIYLTIHTDPIVTNDKLTKDIKKKVEASLKKFDDTLTIHDFVITASKTNTKIIFDVIIPFDKDYTKEELEKYVEQSLKSENTKYSVVINIDRPFY